MEKDNVKYHRAKRKKRPLIVSVRSTVLSTLMHWHEQRHAIQTGTEQGGNERNRKKRFANQLG